MKTLILIALLALPALPALAKEPPAPPPPNALILNKTEADVQSAPAVVDAAKKWEAAKLGSSKARSDRGQVDEQVRAAHEKWLQESRTPKIITPEEYQAQIQKNQQRFNNLNDQMRSTSGQTTQSKLELKAAQQQYRLAMLEARVDNPDYKVFVAEGAKWEEKEGNEAELEQRITLRDSAGKRYSLAPPWRIEKLNNAVCDFNPVWGEIWAIRGAEALPADKATGEVTLKIATYNQVYLLERVAAKGCPLGTVLVPKVEKK